MKLGGYGAVRGHQTRFDEDAWKWVYADDLTPVGDVGDKRPCSRCGKFPTADGHDACIANLPGDVIAACCGHGIEPPYMMFGDGSEVRGQDAIDEIERLRNGAPGLHNSRKCAINRG